MIVIIAYEKHDTVVYASARAVLRQRIDDGYWYTEDGETARAQRALDASELQSLRFLESRSDYEYERIDRVQVIGSEEVNDATT